MSNSITFCALFLVNPWPSFKMHHFCHFQGPTGLEATWGPGGPSQPVQSIKIDKERNLESKYTQHRPPQRVSDFWPSLKIVHPWHFQSIKIEVHSFSLSTLGLDIVEVLVYFNFKFCFLSILMLWIGCEAPLQPLISWNHFSPWKW